RRPRAQTDPGRRRTGRRRREGRARSLGAVHTLRRHARPHSRRTRGRGGADRAPLPGAATLPHRSFLVTTGRTGGESPSKLRVIAIDTVPNLGQSINVGTFHIRLDGEA